MAVPPLWTGRRLFQLTCLSAIGIVQATAAIIVAVAGSRLVVHPGDAASILTMLVLVGASGLVFLRVLQRRLSEGFALDYVKELRVALISHVMRMSVDEKPMRFGLVMTRLVNDMSAIKLWLANGLISIIVAGSVLLTITAYLAVSQPGVLLALVPAICFWLICVLLCIRPLNGRIRESRRRRGKLAAKAGAVLNGRLTLLLFGRHGPVTRSMERHSERLNSVLVGRATYSGALRSLSDLVFPIVAVCIGLGMFGIDIDNGGPNLLGILILTAGIVVTQLNAVALGTEYQLAHRIAMARLDTVFRRPVLSLAGGRHRLYRQTAGRRLTVRNLPVGGEQKIVSFEVEKNDLVVLSGLSPEEGTELFFKLIGLVNDRAGEILIDGRSRSDVGCRDWWRTICLVSPLLSSSPGTVEANGTLGAPKSVSRREVDRVFARFGLTPDMLAIPIREQVRLPSETALAIRAARGVLRRADIVLVDDPELLRDSVLMTAFLDEIGNSASAVIIAARPCAGVPDGCREIRLN